MFVRSCLGQLLHPGVGREQGGQSRGRAGLGLLMGMARYKASDRQASDSCRYFYFILFHFTLLLFFVVRMKEGEGGGTGGLAAASGFGFLEYNGKVNSFAMTMAMVASVYPARPAPPSHSLATPRSRSAVSRALSLPAPPRPQTAQLLQCKSKSSLCSALPLPSPPTAPAPAAVTKLRHFHVVLCACVSSRYFICMSYRKRGVFCILCAH